MDILCQCGCGQPLPEKHLRAYRYPYLRGHASPDEAQLCQCGCGGAIPWKPEHRYRPAKRLPGHFTLAQRAARLARPKPGRGSKLVYTTVPCACGCGQTVVTPDERNRPRRHVTGHNTGAGRPRGEGRWLNAYGYVIRYAPEHPTANRKGTILEHRLVVEQTLGRALLPSEHVHHQNGVKADNRPENLEVVDIREHGHKHGLPRGHRFTPEQRARHSERMKAVWAKRKASAPA